MVAAAPEGVVEDALLRPRRELVLEGVGVASGVVNRRFDGATGVDVADERRPRFRRVLSPGDE